MFTLLTSDDFHTAPEQLCEIFEFKVTGPRRFGKKNQQLLFLLHDDFFFFFFFFFFTCDYYVALISASVLLK